MKGGDSNYEGYCDGDTNITQCEPGALTGSCQLGGSSYNGYCDTDLSNGANDNNLSQCNNSDIADTCGGNKPHLMNLVDFKKQTNKIIKKYKNEIGYDTIKIKNNVLPQLRSLIEHNIVFS
jgi:hypothetical protein